MDMYLTLAYEVRIVVQVVGDVTLILDDGCVIELKDCLYVPNIGIEPLKARHDLTKLDFTIPRLFFYVLILI